MKPGAIAALLAESDHAFDGIEIYLNLRKSQRHHLNLMTEHSTVCEFKSYEAIVSAWFPHRRALYEHRIRRRKMLLRMRLELETQIQRYCIEAKHLSGESTAAMTAYVTESGYLRLSPGLLTGINILSDEELERRFFDGDYKYLFGVKDSKRSKEAIAARAELIADLTRQLTKHVDEIFPGAGEWLAELDALRGIIEDGRATGWKYKDSTKYTL
jgi:hypothetical protein